MSADPRQFQLPFLERPAPSPPTPRKSNVAHAPSTAAARSISFDKIKGKRSKRLMLILRTLSEHGPLTARQILRLLIEQRYLPPAAERNQVSPRISEATEAGCIEALEELRTVGSEPPASVWKITERGLLLLDELQCRQKGEE